MFTARGVRRNVQKWGKGFVEISANKIFENCHITSIVISYMSRPCLRACMKTASINESSENYKVR